ncbi:Glycogenin-1 [Candida viswanathii]|uniref:glycogenin glucosyltransferase n=1 Tax=Candida viswanathii TaxID=5486 RepID=A0A367XYS2_9ASCO|nr:Glycogenin-1 [Candida viswanathii]
MSFAYATLLIGESYLPGVLTLGQKLKQLGTTHKLLVLLDTSSISPDNKELVESIYDEIIPIDDATITAPLEKLTQQLNRQELSITYSKILLWNQTDYDSIVYLDADVLPLANFDDVFEKYPVEDDQIAASPDSGWPDIFNSGVFKIRPSKETFDKLVSFTSDPKNTFDGADQGLLNEYFPNWIRLPYLYNVTPNYRHDYQYLPAFNRFFNDIKVLHYIGEVKPWHYDNILASDLANFHQYWWDDFNKFFGGDAHLKYKLLNLPKGEAVNLKFNKTTNAWEDATDVAGGAAGDFEEEAANHPPLFPWEHREEKREPKRIFKNIATTESIESGVIDEELAKNIETLKDTQIASKDVKKSPPLLKSYGFGKSSDKSFNPDKSLAEVSKLPFKFFSKEKAKKEEEEK